MADVPDIGSRVAAFCREFGLRVPILLAPMAGACPPVLSAAVANAGGMGACGALLMSPQAISDWAQTLRGTSNGSFQMNLWIPDPEPARDPIAEDATRAFLRNWGPEPGDADVPLPDFDAQCAAILRAQPRAVSTIMGLWPAEFVEALKARNIAWFATATTVSEARAAVAAGADAIVAQGMEAGGHRGAFDAGQAETALVGLFALLPAIVDAVDVPVIATGGIGDARGIAAALMLGASAAQIGTGFLRTPEAAIAPAWAEALARAQPEHTATTRAFSGRLGRALTTSYVTAAGAPGTPLPAPYPIQRNLTAAMRTEAATSGRLDGMQAWAGQSARLASNEPAGEVTRNLWLDTQRLLGLSQSRDPKN